MPPQICAARAEDVQPLLAERRARVAADGCDQRRIVEAFTGAIVVDDDDRRGSCRGRTKSEQRRDADIAQEGEGAHAHFTSRRVAAGAAWPWRNCRTAAGVSRHACWSLPSGPLRATS